MTKLLITLDIDTDRPRARVVLISAARPDEMPMILQGPFSDRHALLDTVYLEALKRKEAKVKKPAATKEAAKPATGAAEEAQPAAEVQPDQLDRAADLQPAAEAAPASLPVIEGDDAPAAAGDDAPVQLTLED